MFAVSRLKEDSTQFMQPCLGLGESAYHSVPNRTRSNDSEERYANHQSSTYTLLELLGRRWRMLPMIHQVLAHVIAIGHLARRLRRRENRVG